MVQVFLQCGEGLGVVFNFPNWVRGWHFADIVDEVIKSVAFDSFGWRGFHKLDAIGDGSIDSINSKEDVVCASERASRSLGAILSRGTQVARALKNSFCKLDARSDAAAHPIYSGD
jgi:hypothetical protein